jgi:hypothetical protein
VRAAAATEEVEEVRVAVSIEVVGVQMLSNC